MIKSPEKQYNAYRILKVLSNQDYLAVDYTHLYFILSPVKNRYQSLPKTRPLNQIVGNSLTPNILNPKQCIEIDHILYYVFEIGKKQVICANNIDKVKFNNPSYLANFLLSSIRQILKFLLKKEAQKVRKCIDIQNGLIINEELYLLDLNRGKVYPRSLDKSQRLGINRAKDDDLQRILQNQFRIIKYFGLLLWEIVYKTNYYSNTNKDSEKQEGDLWKKLLTQMINKTVTYEYLQIRLSEQQNMEKYSKERKPKMLKFTIKKQNMIKLRTQSSRYSQSKLFQSKQISTQLLKPNPLYSPHTHKRNITQIQTGNEGIYRFKQRSFHLKGRESSKFNQYFSGEHSNKSRQYQKSKLMDRIARQQQLAKSKINKFLQAKFTLKDQGQEISQTLRAKLISKMQRLKTEYKNYSNIKDRSSIFFSQNKITPQWTQEEQHIARKLQYPQDKKEVQKSMTIRAQIDKKEFEQIEKQQNLQEKVSPQGNQQVAYEIKKQIDKDKQMIQFERVNLQSKIQHQPNPKPISKVQQTATDNKNTNKEGQVQFSQNLKNNVFKKKIDQYIEASDEIETIKLQKTVSSNKKQKPPIKHQQIPKNQKPKLSIPKAKVEQLVVQYQSLINILGNLCSKSILNKKHYKKIIEWQKAIYFIYERYVYQRKRMQQALLLGVKQVIRKNRIFADDDWDEWLKSEHKQQLLTKMQQENKQIKDNFNKFANKLLKEGTFSRKIQHYIRNREKYITPSAIKVRTGLSKITIFFIVKLFDSFAENEIESKQVKKLVFDCIYVSLIISELDNMSESSQWVSVGNYEKYQFSIQKIVPVVDLIYELYYDEQTFNGID